MPARTASQRPSAEMHGADRSSPCSRFVAPVTVASVVTRPLPSSTRWKMALLVVAELDPEEYPRFGWPPGRGAQGHSECFGTQGIQDSLRVEQVRRCAGVDQEPGAVRAPEDDGRRGPHSFS